jgi:hypothetical protein
VALVVVLVAATVHPVETLTGTGGSRVGAVEDATTGPHCLGPCSTFGHILATTTLPLVVHHSEPPYRVGKGELRDIPINDVLGDVP